MSSIRNDVKPRFTVSKPQSGLTKRPENQEWSARKRHLTGMLCI